MPDYHVVSLRYALKHENEVTFDNPPPVEFETEEAKFRLDEGSLLCEMKIHFRTADAARAVIDPTLRAWEIEAALKRNLYGLRFEFVCGDVIDREPTAAGNAIIAVSAANMVSVGLDAILCVGWASYPDPPQIFRVTPDVESLFLRYKKYLERKEPLLSMAYFCLTVLEASAGSRADAAQDFRIERNVLNKLGELTSERGDAATARKRDRSKPMQPLSGTEATWINECVKAMILRVGDTRSFDKLPVLTMADLPGL